MVIIALHYHCYDLFGFFFMLKLLQYCNYIIIVMQIKLMLLLLLLLLVGIGTFSLPWLRPLVVCWCRGEALS